ncbi:MAG: hypothetical protein K1Y01_08635 [Vicinamibacteria bacterium]|nr:hypothetical protein [Vicinamibacteria bacterium]
MKELENLLRRAIVEAPLRRDLQTCRTEDEFIDVALRAAGAESAVAREDFKAALLTASRGDAGPRPDAAPDDEGWVPTEVSWRGGEATVRWRWIGRRRLREPFFSDTILAARAPYSRFVRLSTSLETLERQAAMKPGLPLLGIIAHVSRCGSTLVSQMLASLPFLVVASEPPPFDSVLRGGPSETDPSVRQRWMRSMASALGQPRDGGETGFVMKLDSWHLPHLRLVRDAFPRVPLVVLYREPAAVLASQMREPGLHMAGVLDGPPFDGVPFPGNSQLEYRAKILGRLFEAAADAPEDALVVAYEELPDALPKRIVPFLGLDLDFAALERVRAAGQRDAKSPASVYSSRGEAGAGDSTPAEVAREAERWAGAAHRALELRSRRQ